MVKTFTVISKKALPGELFLLIGLVFCATGLNLLIKANFGISANSSLPYVLSIAWPVFTNGTWNAIVQCCWLFITMAAIKKIKPAYFLSFLLAFVFGVMLDRFALLFTSWSDALTLRLFYYAAGFLISSLGVSAFMVSGMPLLPFETVVRAFTTYKRMSVRLARTGMDLCNLTAALLFSLLFTGQVIGIGIGTVISALLMGSFVGKITGKLNESLSIRPKIAWLGRHI